MNRDDIIRMAEEAGFSAYHLAVLDQGIYRFADSVAAVGREKVAAWMMQHGYATGHGESVDDLLAELDWQIDEKISIEREACAKVLEAKSNAPDIQAYATAIRVRGQG